MLELDPELQALILLGVNFLVMEGLKAISAVVKIDLSGAAAAVTAGVMAVILALLSGVFSLIPPEYHEVARVVMVLIVAIFGSAGLHRLVRRFSGKG